MPISTSAIFFITLATIAGILCRPFRVPEYAWALIGAAVLCLTGLLPWEAAGQVVMQGTDVYLFLAGLMMTSELARREGVFDYLAHRATRRARGSSAKLFLLVYAVGVLITVFMSNDATVVVLTPAVLAVIRTAKIREPLPYLCACAFVANAASFVLPISNPANLVVFGERLPRLTIWIAEFMLPSLAAVAMTYLLLRWMFRSALSGTAESNIAMPKLSAQARWAVWSLAGMAAVMLIASALGRPLGLPTFVAAVLALAGAWIYKGRRPFEYLGRVAWSILPLVAGLFVVTAAMERSGAVSFLVASLAKQAGTSQTAAAWVAGIAAALGCNIANNLPLGMLAGAVIKLGQPAQAISGAILIGVDLGPNLSITGSLASFLWIAILRREGIQISATRFLKIGIAVMPPALLASIGIMMVQARYLG